MTPRCGRGIHSYEAVWGALIDEVVCGRPHGHNPPCRSVQSMERSRERQRERWPQASARRKERRAFAQLSLNEQLAAVVTTASAQAQMRATGRV